QARIRNVVGKASRTVTADELFDFTHGPTAGSFEPLLLGGRQRDASDLTRQREVDGARSELLRGLGQLFECFGHPEFLLREFRAVAEKTVGVFVEGGKAEPKVRSRAAPSEKRASLLEIEPRPFGGETNELFMGLTRGRRNRSLKKPVKHIPNKMLTAPVATTRA
ncbi:MAG TPA: hypothetical protein VFV94_06420, partial [Polyangiaceae bacterium]|nr:hypothetical protein [Polyangiaceae bacterium]